MEAISPRRASLTSQVHASIRDAIVLGELRPGSLHSVTRLADRLQVSRSPVREALISLADQGMIAFERNRGVRILQATASDLEEVFTLRLLLEVPAAYRAAQELETAGHERLRVALGTLEDFVGAPTLRQQQELDAGFHRVILEAAGNRRLASFVDTLRAHQMVRGVSTAGKSREPADIHREHIAIYERVVAGDAKGAAAAMQHHLATSARLLFAQEAGADPGTSHLELAWLAASQEVEVSPLAGR